MFFTIDPTGGLAIYDQVVRQVKFAVAGDVVKEGELVPSVRELARELTINPNTVARAYRQLQADQVLESVRGTGLAVSAGAGPRCRTERVKLIRDRLRRVLAEARQSMLDGKELRDLSLKELQGFAAELEDDIFEFLSTASVIDRRKSEGGTATANVRHAVEAAREILDREETER